MADARCAGFPRMVRLALVFTAAAQLTSTLRLHEDDK